MSLQNGESNHQSLQGHCEDWYGSTGQAFSIMLRSVGLLLKLKLLNYILCLLKFFNFSVIERKN